MEAEKMKSTILTYIGIWEERASHACKYGDFDYAMGIREIIHEIQEELELWR